MMKSFKKEEAALAFAETLPRENFVVGISQNQKGSFTVEWREIREGEDPFPDVEELDEWGRPKRLYAK